VRADALEVTGCLGRVELRTKHGRLLLEPAYRLRQVLTEGHPQVALEPTPGGGGRQRFQDFQTGHRDRPMRDLTSDLRP